jgi:DNA polymerase-3 subunit delta
VLSALSGAYTDLYRAKALEADGLPLQTGIDAFGYRGREFRLKNAARDGRRVSAKALGESIDLLAETDMAMKSAPGDRRVMLEQTVVELLLLARG